MLISSCLLSCYQLLVVQGCTGNMPVTVTFETVFKNSGGLFNVLLVSLLRSLPTILPHYISNLVEFHRLGLEQSTQGDNKVMRCRKYVPYVSGTFQVQIYDIARSNSGNFSSWLCVA